jgi:type IV pilus assembly protein PilE
MTRGTRVDARTHGVARDGARLAGNRLAQGFTLIELMVVVAIVAILAAIAYPSYEDSIRKSRRGQAQADLVELATQAERFHTVNNTYVGFWDSLPAERKVSPREGDEVSYELDMEEVSSSTFTLVADPKGRQLKDTRCLEMTLDQAGQKTESGSGQLTDCW